MQHFDNPFSFGILLKNHESKIMPELIYKHCNILEPVGERDERLFRCNCNWLVIPKSQSTSIIIENACNVLGVWHTRKDKIKQLMYLNGSFIFQIVEVQGGKKRWLRFSFPPSRFWKLCLDNHIIFQVISERSWNWFAFSNEGVSSVSLILTTLFG